MQVRHLVDISKMFNEIKAACTPVGLRNERYRQKGEASSVSVNDIMLDAHFLFFYFPRSSVPLPVLSLVPQGRLKNRWCLLSRFGHVLLLDPHDCSPQGSSADGILQARILEWAAMPPPGDLPNPGIEPASLMSPAFGSSVQSLRLFRLFATPRTAARQASLPIINSWRCQAHVHHVGDAIQPSHPLSSPSSPAFLQSFPATGSSPVS